MSERIVLKWPLLTDDETIFMLPGPVVAVAWQHGNPTLWIEHAIDSMKLKRRFRTYATGVTIQEGTFVGSATSDLLVFHVFEVAA